MRSDMEKCFEDGVSRRSFLRTLGAASAAAAAFPAASALGQAQQAAVTKTPGTSPSRDFGSRDMGEIRRLAPGTVIISSNENPLGPSAVAISAINTTTLMGGRYHQEEYMETINVFTDQFGLPKPERSVGRGRGETGWVGLFPGSGGPLDLALMSNLGPDKPLVYADPSYEQGPRAADAMKAPKFPVKLTPTYAHDVKAMLAAHPSPGAYYIVNPNNPTATMTPREDIIWLLNNKPKGSVVIVDEAYFHFSNLDPVTDSMIPLVKDYPDLIVTRTFSKIYGMAGLRAGVVIGHPERLAAFSVVAPPARSVGSISITSAAGARASLQDNTLVPTRRKINADVREETIAFMNKNGYKIIPGSQANFFMVDVDRPGHQFQQDMLKEKIAIGRTWAAMPNWVRVTVGTKEEMGKFQTAFVKCMDLKPTSGPELGASLHMPTMEVPSELYRG
jgi:histidinol-phosphate aminotransferase